jgi:soluble lytic murein transglycosylase
MRVRHCIIVCLLLTCGVCTPTEAEVKLSVRPDGTLVMHNDGGTSKRQALRWREVPQEEWDGWIRSYATQNRIDPRLVHAVIQVESAYDHQAVSKKGAVGLMQLMPATARDLAVADPYDPEHNIRGGVRYLRYLLDEFGEDLNLALAAYNAGPTAVRRWAGIPPYDETRDYVRKVLTLYRGYTPDLPQSPDRPAITVPGARQPKRDPIRILRGPDNRIRVVSG